MLCKYCGAQIKFYDKYRTECGYCGAELFKAEYLTNNSESNSTLQKEKDYNITDIKVNNIVRDIARFHTYKAYITWEEPVKYRYEKRNLIMGKVESFVVEFDLHKYPNNNDYYIDIISDIPNRFDEKDIQSILFKALYEWSYLKHNSVF